MARLDLSKCSLESVTPGDIAVGVLAAAAVNLYRSSRGGVFEEFKEERSTMAAPGSHVKYQVEEPGPEDVETRPGPTMMQKLKEKVSDYENHLKGKESSDKEDPHPELSYIQPAPGDGKHHATLGKHVPAQPTKHHSSSVKDDNSEGVQKRYSGEGADEPTTMERIKAKFVEAENHMKGKQSSAVEDPHPELAYITPTPQEEKQGFFSQMQHKLGGQDKAAAAVPKGTGSSELGSGYEEDGEDKTINPAAVPKYDEGVKPQP